MVHAVAKSVRLLTIAVLATAASPHSNRNVRVGEHAGLIISGLITEGGVPCHFTQTLDLVTGESKRIQEMGNGQSQSGYDGLPWSAENGILTETNLPSAVADRRSEAWIDMRSWRMRLAKEARSRTVVPHDGAPIRLTFDASSGRLEEASLQGDWGPIIYRFSNWRRVGLLTYPFRREEVDPTGSRTILEIESVKLVKALHAKSLSRPRPVSHAEIVANGQAVVPYVGVGARKTHILVDARINGRPAKLVFDTGAANYITTDAAPNFGLKVSGGLNLSGTGEGSTTGGYAQVERIALGDAALRNETVVIGPSPFPRVNGKPADAAGLTGFEFLAGYVTTVDYPAQQLRFAMAMPKLGGGVRLPFFNDGFHIYVAATIDGISGLFGLDTGDGGTVTLFPEFVSRHEVRGASGDVTNGGGGLGGQVMAQAGVVDRFSFGGLNFDKLPVRFSHNRTGGFGSRSIAGNLGGAILQCFSLTIDFDHRVLLLHPAAELAGCAPGGKVSRD